MSKPDTGSDRPTPNTQVITYFEPYQIAHAGVRKTLEYLRGERNGGDLSVEQDLVPALKMVEGRVVLRYRHTGKTEWIWPATGEGDLVSSCYYDSGQSMRTNAPMSRDELANWRHTPEPDWFVPAELVDHPTPSRALTPRSGGEF